METEEKSIRKDLQKRSFAIAIMVTAICIMAAIAPPVSAGQVCWSDTFSDESGIASAENITVSGGDAKIRLPRWVYDPNPVLKIPSVAQWQTFGMAFNITGDGTWTTIIGEFYPPGAAHGYYWNGTQWVSDPSRVAGLGDVRGAWPAMAFNVTGDGTWTMITGDIYGGFHGYYWNGTQWVSDPARVAGLVNVECDSTPALAFNVTGDGTWTLITGELGHCGGYYTYDNCAGFYGYYWNGTQWVSDPSRVAGLGRIKCYSCPSMAFNPRGDGKWILISGDERGGWGGKFYGWYWNGTQWVSDSSVVAGLGGSGDWLHWTRAIAVFNLTGNGNWSVITANDQAPQKGFCWRGGQRGKLTSRVITPANLLSWDRFFAHDTVPAGTNISYQILDASNNTIMNVVDGQDISGITAASIRLFGNLTTSTTSDTPLLHDWSVCWEEEELPSTPFLIYGYVNHTSGNPLNGPNVTITNARTGEVFTAKTNESANYYQVITSSGNVSAGDLLRFNATNSNSTEFDHNVTEDEINSGGFRQDIVVDNPEQELPPTPFLVFGVVNDTDGNPENNPNVSVTNLNTSESYTVKTTATSNYYQLVLANGTEVNATEILQFNATSTDGSQSNITNHTVTRDEIASGGIFNFNITLVSEAPPGMCGDVNGDGKINMDDVMTLWYDYANYPYPGAYTVSNEWAADVTGDGIINMDDVMTLWYDYANYPYPGAYEVHCHE